MNRKIFHLVNGILTFPGASDAWNRRGMLWINATTPHKAVDCEYLCGPITRALWNKERAWRLMLQVNEFDNSWQKYLVGHSNGCDVIIDALRLGLMQPIKHIHLVCAACEADFNKNGLNRLLTSDKVGQVTVYIAGLDRALALAHTLPGRLLGYGTLGLRGPLNVLPSACEKLNVVNWPERGHSTCWEPANFIKTMSDFVA